MYWNVEKKKAELLKKLNESSLLFSNFPQNIFNPYIATTLKGDSKYVTIRRGKTKIPTKSKQHRYLHWQDLPHSHVKQKDDKKQVTRSNV